MHVAYAVEKGRVSDWLRTPENRSRMYDDITAEPTRKLLLNDRRAVSVQHQNCRAAVRNICQNQCFLDAKKHRFL